MNQKGFSLLELIVAIAIVGLIVGIVALMPRSARPRLDRSQAAIAAALSTGSTVVLRDSADAQVVFMAAYPSGIIVTDTMGAQAHAEHTDTTSP